MLRKILVLTTTFLLLSTLALACKGTGGTADGDGGKAPKLICKMNSQCWICPDDAAMKKCILNPVTSGCKQGSAGDCS